MTQNSKLTGRERRSTESRDLYNSCTKVAPNGRKDQIRLKINTNWGKISNRNVNISQNELGKERKEVKQINKNSCGIL